MKRSANVLVDLDGTLTDPFEGIAGCIRHAMRSMELEAPQEDELRGAIGPPLRQSFARLLARHGAEGRVEEAMRSYRERFSSVGLLENRVYPGVLEMLGELNAAGCRLFIATSKPTVFARRIVDHFGLSGYFAGVYGSELDGRLENKGDLNSIGSRRRGYRGRRCGDDWGPESRCGGGEGERGVCCRGPVGVWLTGGFGGCGRTVRLPG